MSIEASNLPNWKTGILFELGVWEKNFQRGLQQTSLLSFKCAALCVCVEWVTSKVFWSLETNYNKTVYNSSSLVVLGEIYFCKLHSQQAGLGE